MKTLFGATCTFVMIGLFSLSSMDSISAQNVDREIGLRFGGLDNFNLLYKRKAKKNDSYVRYRLGAVGVNYSFSNSNSLSTAFSFSIGKEKRKMWSEKLTFLHGPEFFTNLAFSSNENRSTIVISPGIGYALGVLLDLSEKVYIGTEIIPNIQTNININSANTNVGSINLGGNLNSIAVLIGYRFNS